MKGRIFIIISILLFFSANPVYSQVAKWKREINSILEEIQISHKAPERYYTKTIKINNKRKRISIYLSKNFAEVVFTKHKVDSIKSSIKALFGSSKKEYSIYVYSNTLEISNLIPNILRDDTDIDASRLPKNRNIDGIFVENMSRRFPIDKGLVGKNIALWNSHGWYYEQRLDRWEWQRARILTTVEDKFTTQVVHNFLLPMLENAGAYVLMPKERDPQANIIICDNDETWRKNHKLSAIHKKGSHSNFIKNKAIGFADKKEFYEDRENPFDMGTAIMMKARKDEDSWVEYIPNFQESGYYSVSVCYPMFKDNASDAKYTVYHSGGENVFKVNQTMGGGTWIYLGTFYFDKDDNPKNAKVVLSNQSDDKDVYVMADAIKFGGGMGNISRRPATQNTINQIENDKVRKKAELISPYSKPYSETSKRVKFYEGSRYYLQWAGMPFDIYSHTFGMNDYIDDYASRGKWVNYLNNGSVNIPDSMGLKIPVNLSLAFHSDAGIDTSTTVGSLGIICLESKDKKFFPNGQSRYASADMANMILSEIQRDVRREFDKDWTIRGIRNASYAECRTPDVPSMILESMSHQNLKDMKLGLNPNFQFTFSRAVYKGILKFISYQNNIPYVVQPLPVRAFSAIIKGDSLILTWSPSLDTAELTAIPTGYMLYSTVNTHKNKEKLAFDNGILVKDTTLTIHIGTDTIFSYKVCAVNQGGQSFPSEVLSVCRSSKSKGEVLIVNGFTKTSAPDYVCDSSCMGFVNSYSIPYIKDYSFTGIQHNFDINNLWRDDDDPGFGASYGDYEQIVVAGNQFDYPYLHGRAIFDADFSFSSSSIEAIEKGDVNVNDFDVVDVILGKQRRVRHPITGDTIYRTFSPKMQGLITDYLNLGNSIFVSGSYLGKDLCGDNATPADRHFANNILKIKWRTDRASRQGDLSGIYSPVMNISQWSDSSLSIAPNENMYVVESVDAIEPFCNNAYSAIRYSENNMSAAVVYKGNYNIFVMGVPFEAIQDNNSRNTLMSEILKFLTNDK